MEGQPNPSSAGGGAPAPVVSYTIPTVQVGNRIIDPSTITVPSADPNPNTLPRNESRAVTAPQRGGRGGQPFRHHQHHSHHHRFMHQQQPPKLTLSTLPVSTSTQSNGSNVLFFSSVMKPGGVVAATESEAQQQLVRSGAIRPTASNYGRTLAKLRKFDQAEKRDKGTMRVGVEAQMSADADAAAASISTSMFLDILQGAEEEPLVDWDDELGEGEGEEADRSEFVEPAAGSASAPCEMDEVVCDANATGDNRDDLRTDSVGRKRRREEDDRADDKSSVAIHGEHRVESGEELVAAADDRHSSVVGGSSNWDGSKQPSDAVDLLSSRTIHVLLPSRKQGKGGGVSSSSLLLNRFE